MIQCVCVNERTYSNEMSYRNFLRSFSYIVEKHVLQSREYTFIGHNSALMK